MRICWKLRALVTGAFIRRVLIASAICSYLLLMSACEETQGSPYYNCNRLAQVLKIGISREEVIAMFGQPTKEFAPGDSKNYWCLEYFVYAPNIRQKVGERVGFQVVFQHEKLVSWSSILSSADADDVDCRSPWSTPCD